MQITRSSESGYQKKLRSPKWQKRRLEILQQANWKCSNPACPSWIHQHSEYVKGSIGSEPPSLEVHHLYYKWGQEPWDYPDVAFLVLCEDCHDERAAIERKLKRNLAIIMRSLPAPVMEDYFWSLIKSYLGDAANALKKDCEEA